MDAKNVSNQKAVHPRSVYSLQVGPLRYLVWAHPDGRITGGYSYPFDFDMEKLDFMLKAEAMIKGVEA